jgi:predicted RNA binding protein YcfA (HicA-like mRNA interferase family)
LWSINKDIYFTGVSPMPIDGKTVLRELREHGWVLVRVKGSHHLMRKGNVIVPVPVHGSRDLGTGLLAAIEKQTGVKLK